MRWFLLSFCLTVLLFGSCTRAMAQAGGNPYATWSTERVNGRAVTTFVPNAAGAPITRTVLPSAVGGSVTRTVEPGMVKYYKALGIPHTSGVTGATQTVAAVAGRVATKQAVVKAVARTAIGANPLGMTIMVGMAATEIFKFENGQLKTKLVTEESEEETTYPATQATAWRHSAVTPAQCPLPASGFVYGSAVAACQAIGAAQARMAYEGDCSPDPEFPAVFVEVQGNSCRWRATWTLNGTVVQNWGAGSAEQGSAYTCPDGGTLQGTQCVKPAFQGCPEGYQVVPELSGDYRCAPVTPLTAPDYPVTPEMMEDTVSDLIGNDAAKLEDSADWWSQQSDSTAEPMELGPVSPSGPSQLQQSTSTTPTQNNGTKETIVQPNITYNIDNSTLTITENVTHIYRNEEGEEIGRETEENPQEDVPAVTDGELPEVPDFYEQKYPEGMAGVWNEKKAGLQSNPFTALLTSLQGNFSDGGTCPSWTLPSPLMNLNFGGELKAPCWIWDVLGVIFVVTSLFAARRIIFGG